MESPKQNTVERAYKTRVYLNKYQEYFFHQHAGNRRFIYNNLLSYLQGKWDDKAILVKNFGKDRKPLDVPIEKEVRVRSRDYLQALLTKLVNNKENDFLKKTNSQANQEAAHALAEAISKWKNPKLKNFDEPNFKKKMFSRSFTLQYSKTTNPFTYKKCNKKSAKIHIKQLETFLRKQCKELTKQQIKEFSTLKLKGHFPYAQAFHIKRLTFSQDKAGRYFVSMAYERVVPKKHAVLETKQIKNLSAIGCDLGLKSTLTSSDGTTYNPKISYEKILDKKASLQKKLSKKVEQKKRSIVIKRSNPTIPASQHKKLIKVRRRDKYKKKENDRLTWKVIKKDNAFSSDEWKEIYNSNAIKRLQNKCSWFDVKAANIRKYHNHVLSKNLVDKNDVICLEDLNVKGMMKLWGRKLSTLALSQLVDFICYKAENQGKIAHQVDRFYASSKTCCMCQDKKKDLSLKDRSWTCSACGQEHDRDLNASINICAQALKEMSTEKVGILDKKQHAVMLHSFWNDVSAKAFYGSETPKVLPALLGLEDVVDGHCDSSSLDELKDAPVIACA